MVKTDAALPAALNLFYETGGAGGALGVRDKALADRQSSICACALCSNIPTTFRPSPQLGPVRLRAGVLSLSAPTNGGSGTIESDPVRP